MVACLDLIEVDNNSFASILELCPGGDLDSHLQEHQVGHQSLQWRISRELMPVIGPLLHCAPDLKETSPEHVRSEPTMGATRQHALPCHMAVLWVTCMFSRSISTQRWC